MGSNPTPSAHEHRGPASDRSSLADAAELAAIVSATPTTCGRSSRRGRRATSPRPGRRATIGGLLAAARTAGSVPFVIVGDDDELLAGSP